MYATISNDTLKPVRRTHAGTRLTSEEKHCLLAESVEVKRHWYAKLGQKDQIEAHRDT